MIIQIITFFFQHFFYSGRLEKELHGLLPPSVSKGITVIPPPYGADTAWFGAKLISNVSVVTISKPVFGCTFRTGKTAHIHCKISLKEIHHRFSWL